MPGPYDYISQLGDVQSPMDAFVNAIKLQEASAKQRAEQDQTRRLQAAFQRLGPNASYADYMAEVRANPDLAEKLLGRRKMYSDASQGALQDVGQRAFMLLRPDASGNIDTSAASNLLRQEAERFSNSGENEIAETLAPMADAISKAPAGARSMLGLMLGFADPDRFKKVMDASGFGETLDKDYQLDVQLYGKPQADAWRAGRKAAAGITQISGPEGVRAVPALRVNPMIAAQTAAGQNPLPETHSGPIMTFEQATGAVNGLGATAAARMFQKNNYAVRVNSPQEADRLPSGTKIILPDGSPGVVP